MAQVIAARGRRPRASAAHATSSSCIDGYALRLRARATRARIVERARAAARHAQRAAPVRRAALHRPARRALQGRARSARTARERDARRPDNVTSLLRPRRHARRRASRARSRAARPRPKVGSRSCAPGCARGPRSSEALERMWPVLSRRRARQRPVRLRGARPLGGRRRAHRRRAGAAAPRRGRRRRATSRGPRPTSRSSTKPTRCSGPSRPPGRARAAGARSDDGARARRGAWSTSSALGGFTDAADARSRATASDAPTARRRRRRAAHVRARARRRGAGPHRDAVAHARPPLPVGLDDARRRPRPGQPARRASRLGRRARATCRRTTPPRRVTLTVNYRTPAEIMEVATRLLAAAAPASSRPARCAAPASSPSSSRSTPTSSSTRGRPSGPRRVDTRGGTVAVIAPVELHAALIAALADVGAVADAAEALDAPIAVLDRPRRQGPRVRPRGRGRAGASSSPPTAPACACSTSTLTRATQPLIVVHAEPLPEALGPDARAPVRVRGMTSDHRSPPTDRPHRADVVWDLEPLVDGRGADGRRRAARRRRGARPTRSRRTAAASRELDADGLAELMHGLAEIARARRARRLATPASSSRPTPPIPARGALHAARRGARHRDQHRAPLLRARVGRAPRRAGRRAARRRPARVLPPLPALGAPLPPAPADRARGGHPHREGASPAAARGSGCSTSSTSAITVDLDGDDGQRSSRARRSCMSPDRDVRARRGRGGHRRARARPAHARVRVQHAARRQVDRRPPAPLRRRGSRAATSPTRRATSRCRRSSTRCRAATTIPQRWYALKAQLLGIDRLADYDRMASVAGVRGASSAGTRRKELVLDAYASFSPELADTGAAVLRRVVDRRAGAPGQAARRVLRVHGAVAPPVPAAQLDRRAGATCSRSRTSSATACTRTSRASRASSTRPRRSRWPRPRRCSARPSRSAACSTTIDRSRGAARAARREPRGPDRHRVPPDRDEPLRGRDAHRSGARKASCRSTQFGELWADTQTAMLGDAVEITDGYRTWWSYIPHFIGTPGYVYAYAYGQLLALSVYARYEERGDDFVPQYLDLLRAGGSMSPEELGADRRRRPRRPRLLGRRPRHHRASSSTRPRPPPGSRAGSGRVTSADPIPRKSGNLSSQRVISRCGKDHWSWSGHLSRRPLS